MNSRTRTALSMGAAAVLACGVTLAGSGAAVAQAPVGTSIAKQASEASTHVLAPGQTETVVLDGATTMTLTVDEARVATRALVLDDRGLTQTQKAELIEAAQRGTLRSAHWSQFVTGAAYTNTQDGTFYWDGSRVWVTQSYAGYQGSQRCFTNYVMTGWQITNITKSDTGSTTSRNLYCGWNVIQPMWVTTSWSMTATVNRDGGVSGVGASKG